MASLIAGVFVEMRRPVAVRSPAPLEAQASSPGSLGTISSVWPVPVTTAIRLSSR
ncbi:MAG: hypothetical protein K0R62_5443 [Nonomuraea muscovyensis]|nr:hypothetical protein [Nonomuraea muscovyensis]